MAGVQCPGRSVRSVPIKSLCLLKRRGERSLVLSGIGSRIPRTVRVNEHLVDGVDGEVPIATGNGRFRGFLTRMVCVYPRSACFGWPVGGSVSVISVSCGVRRRVHVRG